MAEQIEIVNFPNGRSEQLAFPEDWTEEQISAGVNRFYEAELDTPEDVPTLPPEGATESGTMQESTLMDQLISDAPKMAGGLALPLAAAPKLVQMGAVKGTAAAMGLAGLGGAGGEGYKTVYEHVTGSENAPDSSEEALKRVAIAGGEEAMFEGIGGMIFRGLGAAKTALAPKVNLVSRKLAQKFEESGGKFMVNQLTDNPIINTLADISHHAFFSKGVFDRAHKEQEAALVTMTNNMAEDISKRSLDLSDKQLGQLFLDTAQGGRVAHTGASKKLYNELDVLVGEREVVNTVQKKVLEMDSAGNMVTKTVDDVVKNMVDNAPVDMRTVKRAAIEELEILKRRWPKGNPAGNEQVTLLNNIIAQPDKMLFSDAAAVRSDYLTIVREMEEKLGAGKMKSTATKFESLVTDAMDKAASQQGDQAIQVAYRKASRFYKHGKEIFDNKFLAQMIIQNKKTPEAIAKHIFTDGRVTEITQVKKALRAAAKLDKTIDYDKVWKQMQSGYIENVLEKSASTAEGKVITASTLKGFFAKKTKFNTMKEVLNKEQRDSLFDFYSTVKKVEARPDGDLGMAVKFGQAGLIIGTLTLDWLDEGKIDNKGLGTAATLMFGPRVIARAMVNPKIVKMMTHAASTPVSMKSAAAKETVIELVGELTRIRSEMMDEEQQ
jgi:hypothetical protein